MVRAETIILNTPRQSGAEGELLHVSNTLPQALVKFLRTIPAARHALTTRYLEIVAGTGERKLRVGSRGRAEGFGHCMMLTWQG